MAEEGAFVSAAPITSTARPFRFFAHAALPSEARVDCNAKAGALFTTRRRVRPRGGLHRAKNNNTGHPREYPLPGPRQPPLHESTLHADRIPGVPTCSKAPASAITPPSRRCPDKALGDWPIRSSACATRSRSQATSGVRATVGPPIVLKGAGGCVTLSASRRKCSRHCLSLPNGTWLGTFRESGTKEKPRAMARGTALSDSCDSREASSEGQAPHHPRTQVASRAPQGGPEHVSLSAHVLPGPELSRRPRSGEGSPGRHRDPRQGCLGDGVDELTAVFVPCRPLYDPPQDKCSGP